MNRAFRFIPLVVVAIAVVALSAGVASGGNGSTVLRGHFDLTGFFFLVDGVSTPYAFSCDEQRVQKPDGSATESLECQLDPRFSTPPQHAALIAHFPDIPFAWGSDFFYIGPTPPDFAGETETLDYHGVLTPSGHVSISATYAAP